MTASSTRCCRRSELLGAFFALWLAIVASVPAWAQGVEVKQAALNSTEEGYVVTAQFEIALTHTLEDALNKGVSLYFLVEFELIRPRWYWFNEKIAGFDHQYRMSFNALTRQYRIGVGNLHQNFATLAEALEFMSRVRRRIDLEPGSLRRDGPLIAGLRFRLDTSQLPKPFQVSALGSREWSITSDWYRWTVQP
jgi:Domain of unknown function (DUF4390)